MPETVQESEGGFIFGTEGELVAAMDHLLADPSHRHELGQCAYQAYEQRWTPSAHLQRYFELIRGIAGASTGE
jgi:glycosyltransferase involved in cell wall biosynthesis